MFVEPPRTQFDLNWRMFGIPVRVSPWFWLTSVVLGWPSDGDYIGLVIWVLCVFVSILIHELGHIFMGLAFGSSGHILLYGMGGLAFGSKNLPERWQRIAVSFAGPLAQFVLLIPLYLAEWVYTPQPWARGEAPDRLFQFLEDMIYVNKYWPLLNLLPIWPLDGGQIARELFVKFAPRNGVRTSLIVSISTAGALAVYELLAMLMKTPILPFLPDGSFLGFLFFAMFAAESFMLLQHAQAGPQRWREEEEERLPWERDPDEWKRGRRDDW